MWSKVRPGEDSCWATGQSRVWTLDSGTGECGPHRDWVIWCLPSHPGDCARRRRRRLVLENSSASTASHYNDACKPVSACALLRAENNGPALSLDPPRPPLFAAQLHPSPPLPHHEPPPPSARGRDAGPSLGSEWQPPSRRRAAGWLWVTGALQCAEAKPAVWG